MSMCMCMCMRETKRVCWSLFMSICVCVPQDVALLACLLRPTKREHPVTSLLQKLKVILIVPNLHSPLLFALATHTHLLTHTPTHSHLLTPNHTLTHATHRHIYAYKLIDTHIHMHIYAYTYSLRQYLIDYSSALHFF